MSLSDSPASDSPFEYLELADFLLIAEAILGAPAEQLARMPRLVALAESALGAPQARFDETELHAGTIHKAAVLCERIIRNHPLPDGNKRCGFLCLIESLARNGYDWNDSHTTWTKPTRSSAKWLTPRSHSQSSKRGSRSARRLGSRSIRDNPRTRPPSRLRGLGAEPTPPASAR